MSTGNIVQVIGAVVDVEFPKEAIPSVYDALTLKDGELVFEVQQQLGDGIVRTIAMGASEGLKRGLEVENTGAPISVPVGQETLGRVLDVLGNPIDEKALSAPKQIDQFTQKHLRLKSSLQKRMYWKQGLRLSTFSAHLQKEERLDCLAALALEKQLQLWN